MGGAFAAHTRTRSGAGVFIAAKRSIWGRPGFQAAGRGGRVFESVLKMLVRFDRRSAGPSIVISAKPGRNSHCGRKLEKARGPG